MPADDINAEVGRSDFSVLAEPYRPELLAHCYRMLGSIHDAEDLVQEVYLRAWRAYPGFEGRSSLRTWLYRIATRTVLTALESRARRPLPSGLGAPAEDHRTPVAPREPAVDWLQPAPDALLGGGDPAAVVAGRAGIRLAFVAALQLLSARQRAVLTLRDVLGFHTAEVAELLDTTADAVDSALRRARARLAAAGPVQEELAEPDERAGRALLDRYVDAFTRADADALVGLLRADAVLEMPPTPSWFRGRAAVAGFLLERVWSPDTWQLTPTRANGQPAAVIHRQGEPYGIQVLTLAGDRILRITSFRDPELVRFFTAPRPEPEG
ncbi:RNA polymerase subunit sigma-70 [Kitasatospora sp. NPDC006697]|uniref:RNA polymerase subunit sigma-70 n=1 Tax=Kitasatospora sp. NPDC006697 TaxID=3364020 RepID=UPI0036AA16BB